MLRKVTAVTAVVRPRLWIGIGVISWLALNATVAADEAALTRAKELYLSASYEDALALLEKLPSASAHETLQISEYRVFCLLALNRLPEAQKAIEVLVKANPFYQPSESVTSPRIRSVFVDVRRRLLSTIVQNAYMEAKEAFDRKEQRASAMFERVLDLLADPDVPPAMMDLRTVVVGFRDLSWAAANPANAQSGIRAAAGLSSDDRPPARNQLSQASPGPAVQTAPRQSASTPGGAVPARPGFAPQPDTDADVTPPEAVFQPMPQWTPANRSESGQTFRGSLELSIDENGNVVTAKMRKGANPRYDELLVKAAQTWRFKPARRGGVSIPYVRVVEIELRPSRQ